MTELSKREKQFSFKLLTAWFMERFPLPNFINSFLTFFTTITIIRVQMGKTSFDLMDLWGGLALSCHYLLLRVFDEHNDFEQDLINFPKRVLQRGDITLNHLKYVGIIAFLGEFVWSLYKDQFHFGVTMISFVIVVSWTLLMFVEFFVEEWLNSKRLLYGFSHMLISPLILVWLISSENASLLTSKATICYFLLSFGGGILYELTRKMRGADEECETLASYTYELGVDKLVIFNYFISFLSFLFFLILQYFLWDMIHPLGTALTGMSLLSYIYFLSKYKKNPTIKARKLNEATLGGFFLVLYLVIILVSI